MIKKFIRKKWERSREGMGKWQNWEHLGNILALWQLTKEIY